MIFEYLFKEQFDSIASFDVCFVLLAVFGGFDVLN